MFYGASTPRTALAEIGPASAGDVTVFGVWRPSRPLRLLDLVTERPLPSFYDLDRTDLRWQLEFLTGFANDVSRPIGSLVRHEYVPTQLLTEYVLSLPANIDGILYRSSRTGEPCCVLNVDNDACVESGSPAGGGLRLMLQHHTI